jgi:dihydrofolate synthase/folylpolyglutamate synthase
MAERVSGVNFAEASEYLNSFVNYELTHGFDYAKSLKLERTKILLDLLGNPHLRFGAVHIAGTKGKGSTAAALFSILKKNGFRVGLYTSPHLSRFTERIKTHRGFIGEDEFSVLVDRVKVAVDSMRDRHGLRPSFFEVNTAIAFMYFAGDHSRADEKPASVDLAVVETGLGGRLDATNVLTPFLSVITPVSLEHTDKLGNSLQKIATEKCGIIKQKGVCVSAAQESGAMEVIRTACEERGVRLYAVNKDICYKRHYFDNKSQTFSVRGIKGVYNDLKTNLLGEYQLANIAAAIGAAELLKDRGFQIFPESVRDGVRNIDWPGRLELVSSGPYVVLDAAMNKSSMTAMLKAVREYFRYGKLIVVMGVSKDKDQRGIFDALNVLPDHIILTKADLPRAEEPERLARYSEKQPILTQNTTEAYGRAKSLAGKDDLILITGSIYVLGELREKIKNER